MLPSSLFSEETRPNPKNFINYSSTFKTVKAYVEKSPLGVIIKYVNLEFAWSSKLVHYILSRQLFCKKQHELWFLIEKQPARFSLFEFEHIIGLNCDPIPNRIVVEDVEKSNRFWGLFKLKHPRSTPSSEDVLALCQSPEVCKSWSREDQIRLCYLAILTGGLLGLDRREAIPPAKAKLLMDLEIFEQYPGKSAFVELVNQIKTKTESVIQIWECAYLPCLGEAIGRPIRSNGLCLLRFKGENGKLPWVIYYKSEVHPVWEHQDEDPEIDNLLEFLRQEKSLSTITWQALPEYPLTPIKCNKQNEDQVESDDDEGKYFIQRRQTPERLFSMERPDVGTLQNLTSRIAALEQMDPFVHLVKRVIRLEENARIPNLSLEPTVCEDCDTRKSQRLSKEEEEEDIVNESAKTLALMGSKTLVVGTGDNQLKSLDNAKVQPLTGNEDEPYKASSNIITPSKPIRKSARVAALGDSTYPPGDVLMAKYFFKRFHKPRGWLSFTELDVPLEMYRLRSNGLCLLRFKGENGKLPLGNILQNAKVTYMCPRIMNEVHPVWEHQDDDPEIDNLLEFLRQEKSLSTITWQALPEYPLTPIKCNKRRRVASQRKSKKSKKLASREQENVGDGGENSGDIAENKDQVESDDDEGKYFIQRRQSVRHLFQELTERVEAVEKLINSGPVSENFQSPTGITMDNLASRVTKLEEIYQVKIPEHDRFSNTKLPAKPAIPEKLEGSIGETTTQGIGGPQDLQDVGEGIDVEECAPQTVKEVLTHENAGADIDDQLTFEGEGIEVEECAPQTVKEVLTDENAGADIDDQLTFEGEGIEVEECAPQTVKEVLTGEKAGADIDHDLTFEGEGIDVEECAPQTARGHPDNPEVENAGEDIVDGLLQDINQSYLLEKAEPSKKQDQRLLTPKVEAASESNKEPDYERAIALSSESNNLTYPHPFTPKEKTNHSETTSSADVTIILPSKDLELQVLERKIKNASSGKQSPS
ncbi:hypothetical protein Bca52824_011090 [Brassica carinata]|uniref:DUF1985 domain-containing protein n=1 Tax=Brassica carinata TaxID=52824 RepID=A0A8X8BBV9_BRACI|nr:hypothetical protein Bca52824_011090 [Brassica carinata]